jgi:hypothetical protein
VSIPSDILDLIDSAVHDWETSPDAVRYNGPRPAEAEDSGLGWLGGINMIRAAAEFEQQMLALQHGMATLVGAVNTDPLDQFTRHLREMCQQWTCFVCGTSWYGAGGHECNPRPYDAWSEHQIRVQLLKAYRVRPHEIGIGNMGCACHPPPFPAARDYRRRTKHRNRRR